MKPQLTPGHRNHPFEYFVGPSDAQKIADFYLRVEVNEKTNCEKSSYIPRPRRHTSPEEVSRLLTKGGLRKIEASQEFNL